ncbi:MAG: hypothetical protein PWQ41_1358 [Bacillota bacterium]|jgi:hypothetical protein|nr:hypothetical protein [Bacillota bacterium]MDK2925584.1 hypothetical protein [Bacillota bacterium]
MDDLFTQTRRAFLIPHTIRLPLTEAPGETWAEYFHKALEGLSLEEGEKIAIVDAAIEIVSPGHRFGELIATVENTVAKINAEIDEANEAKLRTIQVTYSAY